MRLKKLRTMLNKEEKIPFFVSDLVNIRYLTGFTGSYARLIVGENQSWFISDSRYEEYARSILPSSIEFIKQAIDPFETLHSILKKNNYKRLYLEEHLLPISIYNQMKKQLKGIKLVPGGDKINELRMIKDEAEIQTLTKAAAITDNCFEHLLKTIKPGMTEWDVGLEIEFFYRSHGCKKSSFEAIVASGTGSSMPHYATSMTKKIQQGEIVLIDMGCEFEGYNSDMTRTIFIESIDPEFEKIYAIVKDAQQTALRKVKPGITTGKLDASARNYIASKGFGDYFGHSLGHGYGLEIHELPAVKAGDLKLKKNMAITIEPGIYIPGKGGVRIEDMVIVTAEGGQALTKSSKEVIVL